MPLSPCQEIEKEDEDETIGCESGNIRINHIMSQGAVAYLVDIRNVHGTKRIFHELEDENLGLGPSGNKPTGGAQGFCVFLPLAVHLQGLLAEFVGSCLSLGDSETDYRTGSDGRKPVLLAGCLCCSIGKRCHSVRYDFILLAGTRGKNGHDYVLLARTVGDKSFLVFVRHVLDGNFVWFGPAVIVNLLQFS